MTPGRDGASSIREIDCKLAVVQWCFTDDLAQQSLVPSGLRHRESDPHRGTVFAVHPWMIWNDKRQAIAVVVQRSLHQPGARDRNRTGTAVRPRDFHHTAAFAAGICRLCAGLCLDHCVSAVGPRRLVSTPSHCWAWLGVVSALGPGISPNLTGFTWALSLPSAQFSKSLVSTYSTTRADRCILVGCVVRA